MIAEVVINRTAKKLNKTFDYNIPKELEDLIFVGSKVIVPFGKGCSTSEAFVIKLKEKTDFKYEIKDIIKIEENLSKMQIELARWMAKRYFCNVSDCIKLMLAPGTRTKNKEKRIKDKMINAVYLAKSIEEIEFDISSNKLKTGRQKKIIEFVKQNEGVTIPEIELFTGYSRSSVNTLVKNGYLQIIERKIERDPLLYKKEEEIKKTEYSYDLELNSEQEEVYKKVSNVIDNEKFDEFLLHGVTGSRKNRNIYATY